MSRATRQQFEHLVSKAVMDSEFLALLIANPRGAAAMESIDLDDQDVAELTKISKDLTRVSKNGNLAADDARSWAIGIMHIRTVRTH
jgi:hypothetical protein